MTHCFLLKTTTAPLSLWQLNDTHKCIITFRFENFLLSTNRRDLICYRALDDVCFNINGRMRVLLREGLYSILNELSSKGMDAHGLPQLP
ncbi:hypothetical protein R1flu_016800 [Riccia fluitans]|uniref:Uncharacterized protein n=1 Tax=Riccia fluitans TaxID=41844 RepID=A0ABD1YNW4_9MARC